MSFIPDWAEDALHKPDAFDKAELLCLKEFYDAWYHYHTIPKDGTKKHLALQKEAGIVLIAKHEVIQNMRHPKLGTLTLNGVKVGH